MKNYIGPGDTVNLTAPDETGDTGVPSGGGVQNGSLFGIAHGAMAAGERAPCKTTGIFVVNKETPQAWAVGDVVYWDDAEKVFTKTSGGNLKVGAAVEDAESAATIGKVKLTGAI